jgi:hypothetical protein
MAWFSEVFDVTLLATIGLIFLVTMVGAYLRSQQVDRCLKSFDGFHVTLERADGSVIWGVLELAPTGLELRYRSAVQDAAHLESSYVFYASEYEDMQALYRYVDQLTPQEQKWREADIKRSFRPGPGRRLARSLRHFIATANDSLTEAVGLLAGRLKRPAGRYINDTGAAQLTTLGRSVIGSVGHLHDPLLERYIGQRVVVEIAEGDEVHEHVGLFKDYSSDFIELLDVQVPREQRINLNGGQSPTELVQVQRASGLLKVTNQGTGALLLHSLRIKGGEELLNVVVDGGETVELHVDERYQEAELVIQLARELDVIIPRTRCLVRHRAQEPREELLPDIVFDIGVVLRGNSLTSARERRLRRQLTENPHQALAAVNLGALLLQKQEFAEAQEWLEHALRFRHSLPDNGRRAQMLIRELCRRQAKSSRTYSLHPRSRSLPAKSKASAQHLNGRFDESG